MADRTRDLRWWPMLLLWAGGLNIGASAAGLVAWATTSGAAGWIPQIVVSAVAGAIFTAAGIMEARRG